MKPGNIYDQGIEWEHALLRILRETPGVQVEQYGQQQAGLLAREALSGTESLLSYLPDLIVKYNGQFVWVDAKTSPQLRVTGNHACEDAATDAMRHTQWDTRIPVVYGFDHANHTPGWIALDVYVKHSQSKTYNGNGNGTGDPFHVISHKFCQPTIENALLARRHIVEGNNHGFAVGPA